MEFNWEEFEQGKLVVWCDTKEKSEDFLKECYARNYKWEINQNDTHYFGEHTYYLLKNNFLKFYNSESSILYRENFKTFKLEIKKGKYIYKLKRKEYTFEEAWKAYEEGKEIESQYGRYKKIKGKDYFHSILFKDWLDLNDIVIKMDEIRNKWYIND